VGVKLIKSTDRVTGKRLGARKSRKTVGNPTCELFQVSDARLGPPAMPYNHPMAQKAFVLFLFVTGLLTPAMAAATEVVDFTIVNRVQFSVPGNWPVIANKSTSERTVFAFQIPNPADKDTSDSSNLSIIATDLRAAQDRDAFQTQAPSVDHNVVVKKLVEGWGCSTFSAKQRSTQTQYLI
jgi:hypothetical protein